MPFAINIAVHRNRNRRVNSRGNGRTIKGYDNRNAVFATESGILGVGSNIASTTIVKAPERNLWSSLFATDRSDFNEEQLRRLEFYQELAISEKQFDEGKYKEAKTALFDLKDK